MNLGLQKIELEKWRGYWRAKGFRASCDRAQPLRIDRGDCYVNFHKKHWVAFDEKGNALKSDVMLNALLKTIT